MLLRHFQEGGWGMYPVLAMLVAVLFATTTRAVALFRASRNAFGLADAVVATVHESSDLAPAIDVCIDAQGALALTVGNALAARDFESRLKAERARRFATLTERHPLIPMLASIAMLFGLLGTIGGLYGGFGCCAPADATSMAAMLAKGLSEVINVSVFGLLVSIIALVAHALIETGRTGLLAHVDAELARVANELAHARPWKKVYGTRAENGLRGYRG